MSDESGPAAGTAELLLGAQAKAATAAVTGKAAPVAEKTTAESLPAAAAAAAAAAAPLGLLPVQVQPLGRSPEKVFSRGGAEICMPTESDLMEWRRHGNGGHAKAASEQWPGVLAEPPPPKLVLPARSTDAPREEAAADGVSGTATGSAIVESLPRPPASVREPIGFVTGGGYSWERGRPNGVGLVSVAGLRELFSKDVLVGLCHTPPTAAVRPLPLISTRALLLAGANVSALWSLLCWAQGNESGASRPTSFVLVRDPKSLRYRPASLMLLQPSTVAHKNEWQ